MSVFKYYILKYIFANYCILQLSILLFKSEILNFRSKMKKTGWLKEGIEEVKEEIKKWPEWMLSEEQKEIRRKNTKKEHLEKNCDLDDSD